MMFCRRSQRFHQFGPLGNYLDLSPGLMITKRNASAMQNNKLLSMKKGMCVMWMTLLVISLHSAAGWLRKCGSMSHGIGWPWGWLVSETYHCRYVVMHSTCISDAGGYDRSVYAHWTVTCNLALTQVFPSVTGTTCLLLGESDRGPAPPRKANSTTHSRKTKTNTRLLPTNTTTKSSKPWLQWPESVFKSNHKMNCSIPYDKTTLHANPTPCVCLNRPSRAAAHGS